MPILLPETALIREAARRALAEDVGPLDITTEALISTDKLVRARIFVKESGMLAGLPVAVQVFRELSTALQHTAHCEDGFGLSPKQTVLELEGPARAILTGERSALNFLQHLSGIATQTRAFVDAVSRTGCRILDTRKTVPGLRQLEKYAVRCGGGINHRMGLYDAFMPKDNHVALMTQPAGLLEAVQKMKAFDPDSPIIFEADSLEQVSVLAGAGVTRILLDNMSLEDLKEAVKIVAGRCQLEASGNMTLERALAVAETGVDFISVGSLTHSVRALDFSLEITD